MQEHAETPITERKVVRRGLIAGIAAAVERRLFDPHTSAVRDPNAGPQAGMATGIRQTDLSIETATVTEKTKDELKVDDGMSLGRRGVIVAAFTVALGALAKAGAKTAHAVDVILGGENATTAQTTITSSTTASVLRLVNSSAGGRGLTVVNTAGSGSFGVRVETGNATAISGQVNNDGGTIGAAIEGTASSSAGIQGSSTSGRGVIGTSASGIGVEGQSAGGTGSNIGVHGLSGSGAGVQGDSRDGIGVIGNGGNIGLVGIGTTGAGIWGQSTSYIGVVGSSVGVATAIFGFSTKEGFGVHGESQSSAGVMAVAKAANAPGIFAQNTTAAGPGKLAGYFDGNVVINGSYTATGTKLAVVPHPDGSMRSLYCTEATEAYFEDFGRGQVVGGVGRVRIEPDFAPLVHRNGYHVFLTAEGPGSLYVSQQDAGGFEVRELGGKANIQFSYRIVAKRVDVIAERLKRLDPETIRTLRGQGVSASAANAPRPQAPINPSTLNRGTGGQPPPINPIAPGRPNPSPTSDEPG